MRGEEGEEGGGGRVDICIAAGDDVGKVTRG